LSSKKNLDEIIKSNTNKALYFFDEARFGTHSKLGHGWFTRGERTSVKVKLGFQNFYVYSAVETSSGQDFSLLLPEVNTNVMNEFLRQFSEHLGSREAIVVMDGAGWHKSKNLVVPQNLTIVCLPAYSPELNPVEKLWQHIKSHIIKNKIYDSLKELETAVCDFIQKLKPSAVRRTCSSNHYSY
jgi:transposase